MIIRRGVNAMAIYRMAERLMRIRHGPKVMSNPRTRAFEDQWNSAISTCEARVRDSMILRGGNFVGGTSDRAQQAACLWNRMADFWPTASEWIGMARRGLLPPMPDWIKNDQTRRQNWIRHNQVRPWVSAMRGRLP